MKCIVKNNVIRRVEDDVAKELVDNHGYEFVNKWSWKYANELAGHEPGARKNIVHIICPQ